MAKTRDAVTSLPAQHDLPGGTVTFLFTDIEGSTGLLKRLGESYASLLAEHHRLLREVFARYHGQEVDTQGDAFFVSFARSREAVQAAVAAQEELAGHTWPGDETVRVRMGLHTGEPWLQEVGYTGMSVHRAARIAQAGHGGQVLLSETTMMLVRDELPEGVRLKDLGAHRLKDMRRPEKIYQLVIPGLVGDFPALSTEAALPLAAQRRTIRGYELCEWLGEGAWGEVYRAVQPGVGRDVAIKAILPKYANDAEFIRRFEAEAQVVARLEHPHIVPLYDYWREPDGAYLVMRWLRGGSLQDALTYGPWSGEAAVRLVEQVASALSAAHHKGVVHRDIKPANILLDEAGNAYLSDFGIATLSGPLEALLELGQEDGEEISTGSLGYQSPEVAVGGKVTSLADLYSFGVVLYELVTGAHPFPGVTGEALVEKHRTTALPSACSLRPELSAAVDEVIQKATAKDPAERYQDTLELAAAFRKAMLGGAVAVRWEALAELVNPYKGLRAFQEADAGDFYGREALVERLLARMREEGVESRFLAVVGPSGCGKSSLVKAGLIPALRRGRLAGAEKWYIVEMLPGAHPFEELEISLLRLATNPGIDLGEQLRRDPRGLLRAARLVLPTQDDQLLLVVDQFEELFTLVEDEAEARLFLSNLYQAVSDPRSPVRVIVTLRADFYDRPLIYPDFSRLVQQRTEVVVPMELGELEQAIQAPAEQMGVEMEAGLVATIVADVVEQPGALPLLQYALTELFERRSDHRLRQADYQTFGGVQGVLGKRAEEIYSNLGEREKGLAKQVFLRLITLGEGIEDTRRRVLVAELRSLSDPSQEGTGVLDRILNAFGDARLLSFDRDPQTRAPTVEVAHEAILQEWMRLKTWLDESRADIRLQRVLASAADEWMTGGKESSFLLRGARLAQFEEWIKSTPIALTAEERLFLETSLTERQRLEAEEADRRRHEAALERRSRNFLRGLVAVFAVAAIVALTLTGIALSARNQARHQEVIARSEANQRATAEAIAQEQRQAALLQASAGLAAQALDELDGAQPERAVLLALETLEQYPYTPQAESALAEAVQQVYPYQDFNVSLADFPDASIKSFLVTPDDQQIIAYLSDDKSGWVVTINVASGEVSNVFQPGMFCGDAEIALSSDGRYVTVVNKISPSCPFVSFDLDTGKIYLNLKPRWVLKAHDLPPAAFDVAWSPDGRFISAGNQDGIVRVWDTASGEVIQELTGHTGSVRAVAWSPDGERLATGGEDGTLRLWDARTGAQISSLLGHNGSVLCLDWSPSGELLASGGSDGVAFVWETDTLQIRQSLRGHTDKINDIGWSSSGDFVATASMDATTRVWNPLNGEQLFQFGNTSPDNPYLDWLSQGNRLAYSTKPIRIMDLSSRTVRLDGHTGKVDDAQWSTDARQIATGSTEDGTVKIWEWPGGQLIRTLNNLPAGGYHVAWSPDGHRLAIASGENYFSVWDTASWERLWDLPGYVGSWLSVSGWSPDGMRLAASVKKMRATNDYTLVLDAESGQELTRITSNRKGLMQLRNQSWAPQGDRFVTGAYLISDEKTSARVWDAASGEVLLELPEQEGGTVMGAYSPDGRYIATISKIGVVRVWDAESGQPVSPAVNLSGQTLDLHWSPNGKRIAVGNANGYVIVLDAMTGGQVARYSISPGPVSAVDWSPDGNSLLVNVITSQQPYIFPAWQTTEELIAYAKECCVWRELTPDERTEFGLP